MILCCRLEVLFSPKNVVRGNALFLVNVILRFKSSFKPRVDAYILNPFKIL